MRRGGRGGGAAGARHERAFNTQLQGLKNDLKELEGDVHFLIRENQMVRRQFYALMNACINGTEKVMLKAMRTELCFTEESDSFNLKYDLMIETLVKEQRDEQKHGAERLVQENNAKLLEGLRQQQENMNRLVQGIFPNGI